MNRRQFLKVLGLLPAVPIVAKLLPKAPAAPLKPWTTTFDSEWRHVVAEQDVSPYVTFLEEDIDAGIFPEAHARTTLKAKDELILKEFMGFKINGLRPAGEAYLPGDVVLGTDGAFLQCVDPNGATEWQVLTEEPLFSWQKKH